jgi:hypothetical protein
MGECVCLGALQPAPIRRVVHTPRVCVSVPNDGGAPVVILPCRAGVPCGEPGSTVSVTSVPIPGATSSTNPEIA